MPKKTLKMSNIFSKKYFSQQHNSVACRHAESFSPFIFWKILYLVISNIPTEDCVIKLHKFWRVWIDLSLIYIFLFRYISRAPIGTKKWQVRMRRGGVFWVYGTTTPPRDPQTEFFGPKILGRGKKSGGANALAALAR